MAFPFSFGGPNNQSNNSNPARTWTCQHCGQTSFLAWSESPRCKGCGWPTPPENQTRPMQPAPPMLIQAPPSFFGSLTAPIIDVRTDKNNLTHIDVHCATTAQVTFTPSKIHATLVDNSGRQQPQKVTICDTNSFDLRGVEPGYYTLLLTIEQWGQASPSARAEIVIVPERPPYEAALQTLVTSAPNGEYDAASLIRLELGDTEGMAVVQNFTSTGGLGGVQAVYKVHCQARMEAYDAKRQQFLKRFKGDPSKVNEVQGWHGTAVDNVNKICHQGFLRQFTKRAAFGDGCYFATNARYSASVNYARPDHDGFQYMFFCRILAGEVSKGRPNMLQPDLKPGTQIPHDSAVDNCHHPSIYVIFGDDQAVADYLVVFQRA